MTLIPGQLLLETLDVRQQLQYHLLEHPHVLGELRGRGAGADALASLGLCWSIRNHKGRIAWRSFSVK